MKNIRSPIDLDQVVTVMQHLHEEDYQEAMSEVHAQLAIKHSSNLRDIVSYCPKNDFPSPVGQLLEDAAMLSWSMRRRFKKALKKGEYKKYRSHREVLDLVKDMMGMGDEIGETDFD